MVVSSRRLLSIACLHDPRDNKRLIIDNWATRQNHLPGQTLPYGVFAVHVHHRQNAIGGFYARGIQFLELGEVLNDLIEMSGKTNLLFIRQGEARQKRDVGDLFQCEFQLRWTFLSPARTAIRSDSAHSNAPGYAGRAQKGQRCDVGSRTGAYSRQLAVRRSRARIASGTSRPLSTIEQLSCRP